MGRAVLVLTLFTLSAACDDGDPILDAGPADSGDAALDAEVFDAAPDAPLPPAEPAATPLIQWVDPFIGTGGIGFGVGSTYPGPQVPFGMIRPGPDTTASTAPAPNHCAGYWYDDPFIRGFSHTRANGMGIPEYGAVALMPTLGMDESKTSWEGYRSPFSHETEEASPGYYAVTLGDGVRVELTTTARVALHRYTFPPAAEAVVLSDIGHHMADVEILDGRVSLDPDAGEISGEVTFSAGYSNRFGGMTVYYVARFSTAPESYGVWQDGVLHEGDIDGSGASAGAWYRFDTSSDEMVEVALAISFVSTEGARLNLDTEMPAIDFDSTRAEAETLWEDALSRVEIEGRSEREFEIFYSSLYRTLLMPTLAMDVDGAYRGLDGELHQAEGFIYLTDFSLWDTYRTMHPLLALLYPEWQLEMLNSLTAMGRDGGFIPRWPLGIGYTGGMVGDPADIVFADSWLKGIQDFDLREAYELMRLTAMGPTPEGASFGGRHGITPYIEEGYIPIEHGGGSAAWTLELAYADHCLALLADELGEEDDARELGARAGNWRNIWDERSDFLIGRHEDGSFPAEVAPFAWQDYYAEGNAWQYLWFVPHDLEGLAEVMGGRDELISRLDGFFEESASEEYMPVMPSRWYWHGNEPDLHAPWIFAALDRPAGSARWVRWALERHYSEHPDGLPGNDDGGTMSAWYVFSAAGIYPLPGFDYYLVGSPIFTRVVLHLAEGDFVIEAPEASGRAIYIQQATHDGSELARARIRHDDLAGTSLELQLGPEPSSWGVR